MRLSFSSSNSFVASDRIDSCDYLESESQLVSILEAKECVWEKYSLVPLRKCLSLNTTFPIRSEEERDNAEENPSLTGLPKLSSCFDSMSND